MATKLLDVSFWQDTLDFSKIKKAGSRCYGNR